MPPFRFVSKLWSSKLLATLTRVKQGGRHYGPHPRVTVISLLAGDEKRILDVGCNDGSFGNHLKSLRPGVEVVGIEADPDQALKASQVLDKVVVGYFPDCLSQIDGKFDAISFNHVLEHLADPWGALQACTTVLNPGGRVVGEVPNIRYYEPILELVFRGRWTYQDTGILDRTHLRFFTRSSLRDLLHDSGFEVVHLSASNAAGSVRYPRTSRLVSRVIGDFSFGSLDFAAKRRDSQSPD